MTKTEELLNRAIDCGALVKPHPIDDETTLITFTLDELNEFLNTEPAPQQDKQETGDYGLTGSSAVCAAPSSEEVREIYSYSKAAANYRLMLADKEIERLAARVPDGKGDRG